MANSPPDKRCQTDHNLLDLSADCLRIVLRLLGPRNACTFALKYWRWRLCGSAGTGAM